LCTSWFAGLFTILHGGFKIKVMIQSYKLVWSIVIFYGIWVLLGALVSYLNYRLELRSIPKNSSCPNKAQEHFNRVYNLNRKEAKEEFRSYIALSFVPFINFILVISYITKIK